MTSGEIMICITTPLFVRPGQARRVGIGKEALGISSNDVYCNMPSRHAEADAFNKIKTKKNMPRNIDIFVIKITKSGQFGNSRPCKHCIDLMNISGFNIKYIYYSDNDGNIIKESFSHMKNSDDIYVSSGMRTKLKLSIKL